MSPNILAEGYSYSPLTEEDKCMLSEFRHALKKTSRSDTSLSFYYLSLVVTFLATGLAAFLLGRLYPLRSPESTNQPFQENGSPLDRKYPSPGVIPQILLLLLQTHKMAPSKPLELHLCVKPDLPATAVRRERRTLGIALSSGPRGVPLAGRRAAAHRVCFFPPTALCCTLSPLLSSLFLHPGQFPFSSPSATNAPVLLTRLEKTRTPSAKSWYADQDIKSALKNSEDTLHIEEFDVDHVLHCIEFLRQSIMCHADTNIQVERELHGGLLAFGEVYECKDWFQMVDWVNERNKRRKGLDV